MDDNDPDGRSASNFSAPPAAPSRCRSRWPWLLAAAVVLVVGAGVVYLALRSDSGDRPGSGDPSPSAGPIDGKLIVTVRSGEKGVEPRQVEEAGALPVRADGIMSLQVQLNQPACSYVVWVDTAGQVVPLYPWNHDALEVKDVNQSPPVRQAAAMLFNPPIGGGWKFGKRGGLETVFLMVRRTPLDASVRVGALWAPLPPTRLRARDELVVLGLDPGAASAATLISRNRGPEAEARADDEPLRAAVGRLREHFELVRVVRFAHEGE